MAIRQDSRGPVMDADGHVIEQDRVLYDYLLPPYHGHAPLFGAPFFPSLDGFHRPARRVADGKFDRNEIPTPQMWIDYLDEADIAATVLFPTAGLGFGLIVDPDWAAALAHAYNDWLYDQFLRADPRIKGIALIPVQDPSAAAEELRRCVSELGMVGAVLPAAGPWEAFGHPSYWPIYRVADELSCALAVHGAPAQGIVPERLHRLIEVRTLTHPFSQMIQITSMMFGGVFDLFPRVRVGYCEAGSGWAPYIFERMDLEYSSRSAQAPELKVPPSEHIKSGRVYFHTELGERGLAHAIQALGEDAFFCASDYPHEPKEDFPEALEGLLQRDDIPDSAKRKIMWDNPLRFYNLSAASLQSPATQAAAV